MKKLLFSLIFVCLFCVVSKAQKGTAEPGYYPPKYSGGETWTGEVTAVDEDQRTITLTYSTKKKEETFTGVLDKDYWGPQNKKGDFQQVKLSLLMGLRLRAYFSSKSIKDASGTKTKINQIYIIKVVPKEN